MKNYVVGWIIGGVSAIVIIIMLGVVMGSFDMELPSNVNGVITAVCLFVGIPIGQFLNHKERKNDPEEQHAYEVEQKDERNILIRGKAGQFAWTVSMFTMTATLLAFSFMEYTIPMFIMCGG
jgi:hypothetical protein